MGWQGWFSLALVAGVLGTLILTRLKPHVVMMGALTLLVTCGVLTGAEALAGFANEGLITVAAMFVVAAGIHASGGAELIVTRLLGRPKKVRAAMWRMFTPVALLSGFLNNTPVVATMIPAVNSWSRKTGIAPSKLMIPLSYASILGGTMTLIGTSTNLVVDGQYRALTGGDGFSLFSITAVGLPVALFGLLFMWLFFPRLLPERKQHQPFGNMREFTLEVAVAIGGPLVGKTIEEAGLRHLVRVYLVEIERDGTIITAVPTEERLRGGDRLVFAGDTDAISDLLRINGIVPSEDTDSSEPLLADRAERRLVEAVVSPHCDAVGHAIRDARFRDRYGAAVLAAGFGLLSMLNAALLGAAMMLVTGCCSVNQAEKSLDLTVLITIGASFALGAALEKSGAALFLASSIIDLSGGRPWLMLVLTYITVSLLTETITNNAAAILMLPIVLGITASAGLNPTPFIFAIMMAASASFATPLGYQTNLMVYGPGGYTFAEFLRVGIPMNLAVGSFTVAVLLLGWPLERLA